MNKLIFYILLTAGLATWLCSCSEAKKLHKAEQRVLASRAAVDRVGKVWSDLHPCVPDSVVKYLPGRTDTNTIVKIDTVVSKDTDTVTITKTVVKNVTIRDTIQIAVKDTRKEKLLQEDVDTLTMSGRNKDVQIAELTATVQSEGAKKDKWFWLLIAVSVAFAVYIFKKPILSLITKLPL